MKKSLKKWLLPVMVVTISIPLVILLTSTGPYTIDNTVFNLFLAPTDNTSAQQTFSIRADALPDGASMATQRYLVYFFAGDGHYQLGEMMADGSQASWTHDYTYSTAGTYNPFVETCDVYDDKDLPPALKTAPSITISTPGTPLANDDLHGYPAIITPVRKMVNGHALTYIVTYENPITSTCNMISGEVTVTYDASKVSYNGSNGYPLADLVSNPSAGVLKISFTNLAKNTQKNAFLKFITTGQYQESVVPPTANLAITSPVSNPKECNIDAKIFALTSHSVIENAHDPNHKAVTPASFCSTDQDTLHFLITFQNDGGDTVNTVRITDELDMPLRSCDTSNIEVTDFGPRNGSYIKFNRKNGRLTVDLKNLKMPGTGQQGYGTKFGEAETTGFLKFRVPMACLSPKWDCNAVCNRASIVFECNPPLLTNLAVARLKCNNVPQPVMPSYNTVSCNNCAETDTTLVFPADTATQVPILPNWIAALGSGWTNRLDSNLYEFKWYPPTGLSDPYAANPKIIAFSNDQDHVDYTMVASNKCNRFMLHRRVTRPCNVQLNAPSILKAMDGCTPVYTVSWSASGANLDSLIWQDCTTGSSYTGKYGPGRHYFSVKDPITGCYDDTWLTLSDQPFDAYDDPADCQGNPVVTGATGALTYQWSWNNGNPLAPVTSTQNPPLDLTGKSNVQVTITDGGTPSNCSVVLKIKKGRCWTIPYDWISLGIAIVALGFFFKWWRSRRPR